MLFRSHRNGNSGVVLAEWNGKYVTWAFMTEDEGATYHGGYFTDLWDAVESYLERVKKSFN